MTIQAVNSYAGTQFVARLEVRGTNNSRVHPRAAGAVVMRTSAGAERHCPVRFPGGFEFSLAEAKLPERPDYSAANRLLIKVRQEMTNGASPCC